MLRFKNVGISRGGRPLIVNASFDLYSGEKIALLGANGTGKSTLLGAVLGEVNLESGNIEQPYAKVVSLEQQLPESSTPAWQYVVNGDAALMKARAELAALSEPSDSSNDGNAEAQGMLLATAHQHVFDAGQSTATSRAQALLAGLGFAPSQMDAPVNTLSGGWRMRLNLARALFVESELLLLDEPTNHLDLDAIVWFERWLNRYSGTAIVVSHDRDFVDRVASHCLFLENQQLKKYPGGYSETARQRSEQFVLAQKNAAQTQRKAAHLEKFIERFRAKASKAKQAQSRMKALEKLNVEMPLRAISGLNFEFEEAQNLSDPMLSIDALSIGYSATKPLLSNVTNVVRQGARIGLLGQNGAGKSSLIKALFDAQSDAAPQIIAGGIVPSKNIKVGYFAQQALEGLRDEESPLAMLKRLFPLEREQSIRGFLGRFGFSGENAMRPIGPMSGGEKARVVLSSIVMQAPNFLVLDEPTNHLDAQAREALTEALASFDGALLLVSHDRYMLRATVDELWVVREGNIFAFDGDLEDFAKISLDTKSPSSAASEIKISAASSAMAISDGICNPREERRLAAAKRAENAIKIGPIDKKIKRIEAELTKIEILINAANTQLADPNFYTNNGAALEVQRQYAQHRKAREEFEIEWLTLSEQKDALLT